MKPDSKLIVLRLCGEELDGQWMEVRLSRQPWSVVHGYETTTLVATGSVEWDGFDHCAEVFVPEKRLAEWQAEHDLG